jgi:branched-subunit amino acid transport protein
MVSAELPTPPDPVRTRFPPVRWALAHPLVAVAATAALVRVVAALVLGLRPGYVIGDEEQYVTLAEAVANGRTADSWFPGYGQSLYDAVYAFIAPLTALTKIFGPHQIVGQLLAAMFGVLAAVLTARLGRELLNGSWALAAGMLAALMPSQVLWSSVVLRESMVWVTLVGAAVAVAAAARARSPRALTVAGLGLLICLLTLGHLRSQTLVVAVWAVALAVFTFRSERTLLLRLSALVMVLVVPAAVGLGPAGLDLAERALPALGKIRTSMSIGASSAFVPHAPASPAPSGDDAGSGPSTGRPQRDARVVNGPGGQVLVDNTPSGNLAALPRGLVAVTLRPFPWEPATNSGVLLAKLENTGWLVLYGLAAVGIWTGRRQWRVIAFPVVLTAGILLSSALTQGNLGTAFRHRGQVLWALAVLAAIGLQYLMSRRGRAASS